MSTDPRTELTMQRRGAGPSWWRLRDRDKVKRCTVCGRPFRYWSRLWQHVNRQHGIPVTP